MNQIKIYMDSYWTHCHKYFSYSRRPKDNDFGDQLACLLEPQGGKSSPYLLK